MTHQAPNTDIVHLAECAAVVSLTKNHQSPFPTNKAEQHITLVYQQPMHMV